MAIIVNTAELTFKSLIDAVRAKEVGIKTVHSTDLSYDKSLRSYRAANVKNAVSKGAFPLFAYNRTVLRNIDNLGKRSVSRAMDNLGSVGESNDYKTLWGRFDVNFVYLAKNLLELDVFELRYLLNEDSIKSIKEITITLPDLGDWIYAVEWESIEERIINTEGDFFCSVTGKAILTGRYFMLRGSFPHIEKIILELKTFIDEELLNTVNIPM